MNALISLIIFSFVTMAPLPAQAGPGDGCHFHGSKPAAESIIIQCASQRKEALVKGGKLDKSWASVKYDSVNLVDGKKGKEWRVVFSNPEATDQSKKQLFMFFTPPGNFIAANHADQ